MEGLEILDFGFRILDLKLALGLLVCLKLPLLHCVRYLEIEMQRLTFHTAHF